VSGYGVTPINPAKYEPNDTDLDYGDIVFAVVPDMEHYTKDDVPRNLNIRGVIDEGGLDKFYAKVIPPQIVLR
jgi:hypothetical protein